MGQRLLVVGLVLGRLLVCGVWALKNQRVRAHPSCVVVYCIYCVGMSASVASPLASEMRWSVLL
jgi:hypothetical protein